MATLALLVGSLTAVAQAADFAGRIHQGNQLMQAGKYAEALAIYAELVASHPRDAGLRANLGMAQHLAGKHREAIRNLQAALKLKPGNAPAMVMLGGSYLQLGDPAGAVGVLEKAIAIAPDLEEGHQLLAESLAQMGRYQEAAREFERWKVGDRRDFRAWYGLGRCYEALAREEFERFVSAAPESGYTLALVARNQQLKEQYRSAFHLYRDALQREPQIRGVHLAIAEIYAAMGHAEWAAQERAKEQALGEPDCVRKPGECAFYLGKLEEVAAPLSEPSLEANYWRVRALTELAREAFQRVVERGDSLESHAVRAAMERERGRTADSIREWKAALALSPGNPALEKELAITLRLHEDYKGAREIVQRLLAVSPNSIELNYLMGQIIVNQQQPEAAIPFLQKAVRLEPGFVPARSSLGLALLQVNRDAEAIPHLKAALPLDTDGSLLFRLARAYQKLGDAEAAKQAMTRYRELQTRSAAQRAAAERESQITAP